MVQEPQRGFAMVSSTARGVNPPASGWPSCF
jgi:hypothetical protein